MGYRTPNIDRIANDGMRFTDSYGEQGCTAGRAAFISGQSVYRTGMSKVGIPGADVGWAAEDPTIAELLKPLGYATGQFGKNHLGDLNKHLPTVHGFDEFFGNMYHLNAEEEPDDPKFGPVGKQVIEVTGALATKRMETVDDETTRACVDYIKRQHEAGMPFFVWMNMTHMHVYTHTKNSVSPRTRSLSTQPTTDHIATAGPTPARTGDRHHRPRSQGTTKIPSEGLENAR
jgi:arylsulfatase